jgi:hypothetical protein
MKRLVILLMVYLIPILSFPQHTIRGRIADNNGRPIPFASIGYYNSSVGSTSDSLGRFSIVKHVNDSIKISSVGFMSRTILIRNLIDTLNIILEEKAEVLIGVEVKTRIKKKNKITIGHYRSVNNYNELLALHLQEAVFIANSQHIRGYIDEVKFKLMQFRNKHFMLRIRLYNLDPRTLLPHEDLLFTDNIIHPDELRRNNTFSIKSRNIEMPEGGVFVSFEWLTADRVATNEKLPYFLGNNLADRNYRYTNFKEIKWYPVRSKSPSSDGYDVPNVAITLSY